MNIDHLLEKIQDYTKGWDLSRIKELFDAKNDKIEEAQGLLQQNNANTKQEIQKLSKEKEHIDAEVEMIKTQCTRKMKKFGSVRSDTFSIAKNVIDLEQEVSHYENILNNKQRQKFELEKEVKTLSNPTCDVLFNCFLKGFGVDFVEKEGKVFARIKNKEKQDIFLVEAQHDNVEEVREKIWEFL